MSRGRLADAFDQLAEAAATVALELRASEQPAAGSAPSPAPAPTQAAAAPPPAAADSIDTSMCPKHGKPFEMGQYGEYCRSTTDDPAWGKAKTDRDGNPVLYCKITPKNAPQWLAVHNRAA